MPRTDSQTFLRALDKNGAGRHGLTGRSARRVDAGAAINLAELIDPIPFQHTNLHAKDIPGHGPEHSGSNSFSTFLGDLRAFAVKDWFISPNGSMSSNSRDEVDIRRAVTEADHVETAMRKCAPQKSGGTPLIASGAKDDMGALHGNFFTSTLFLNTP